MLELFYTNNLISGLQICNENYYFVAGVKIIRDNYNTFIQVKCCFTNHFMCAFSEPSSMLKEYICHKKLCNLTCVQVPHFGSSSFSCYFSSLKFCVYGRIAMFYRRTIMVCLAIVFVPTAIAKNFLCAPQSRVIPGRYGVNNC